MEETIERILSHPLLTVTLSLICLLLVFAILKGLLKIIWISLLLICLYFAYLHYFQEDYPLPEVDMTKIGELKDEIKEWVEDDLNASFFESNKSQNAE